MSAKKKDIEILDFEKYEKVIENWSAERLILFA